MVPSPSHSLPASLLNLSSVALLLTDLICRDIEFGEKLKLMLDLPIDDIYMYYHMQILITTGGHDIGVNTN